MFQETVLTVLLNIYAVYLPVIVLCLFMERLKPTQPPKPFFCRDFYVDAACAAVNMFFAGPVAAALAFLLAESVLPHFLPHHLFAEEILALPFWLQCLLALFIGDFTVYWRHRFGHRFIWKFHATHHSATAMRGTVHFRMHPLEIISSTVFETVFLYVIGFEGEAIAMMHLFMPAHNVWQHSSADIDYGWPLRYVLASPNYHKWHHAREEAAVDKNFADIFPVLDIIFGTYYYPFERRSSQYGIMALEHEDPFYHSYLGTLLYPFRSLVSWRPVALSRFPLSVRRKS